jgi:hypothetical protein
MVWGIPAVGAAIIAIMFALAFRDTTKDEVSEEEIAQAHAREKNP